jgi:hypothetical protein
MQEPNSNERYPKKRIQFGSSINVSILQPSGHITICVDPQSYKPINGSTNNLKTSICMHPMQMKDTLRKNFNLEIQLRF